MEPQIRFCTSADGTRIAYATMGEGPPLVCLWGWMGNTDRILQQPHFVAFFEALGGGRQLIFIDRRGTSASQRDVDDLSLEAQVADVGAVVDHLRLERFDLFGFAESAGICVAYAAQWPERVLRLVLMEPYPCGTEIFRPAAIRSLIQLIRENWSLARRTLADILLPTGPIELQRWLTDLIRDSVSPETAAKCVELVATLDIRPYLPAVRAPTLILHPRDDRNVPLGAARTVAASLADCRLVILNSASPLFALDDLEGAISAIEGFLGERDNTEELGPEAAPGDVHTILFTDMEGSTTLTEHLGDAKAQELRRTHDSIVRDALKAQGGSETKHTGDGIMASFPSASRAIECAVAVQRAIAEQGEMRLKVRIGLNAGEPVAEESDLFGTAVNLARRICDQAEPGQILVSDVVRQLAAGKGFTFADKGEATLKGFEKPVRLHEVVWD